MTWKPIIAARYRTITVAALAAGALQLAATSAAADGPTPAATAATADLAHDPLGDVWLDSVHVDRFPDADGDGFASGLAVELDADSAHGRQDVFARLSLTFEDGGERLLHDSGVFEVAGNVRADRVEIEFDLLDAFPTGYYELVVELRDAHRDRLLDVVDGAAILGLAGLPLEDARRDGRLRDDYGHGYDGDPYGHHPDPYDGYAIGYSVGVSSVGYGASGSSYVAAEYSGAGGPFAIAGLVGLLMWRRRSERR